MRPGAPEDPLTEERHDELDRLRALIETQRALADADPTTDEVMGVVVRRAAELTRAGAGVVELPDGDEMVYRAVAGAAAGFEGLRLAVATSLSGRCLLEGRVLRCDDSDLDDRVDREACRRVGARSMLCVPLQDGPVTRGVLKVYDARPYAFDATDQDTLEQLSGVIVAHMRHAAEFERQAFESRHDSLTGLGNRRAYEARLAAEVSHAVRHRVPVSLVLLDLDGFKAVNDREGHPAGDAVLREAAAAIGAMRGGDAGFRIGGDEFALVLAATDADGARHAAGRVTADIARRAERWGVTATAGLATFAGGAAADLHASADARLVQAKALTRSR